MSLTTWSFTSAQDGLEIAAYSWPADTDEPRGVVQIAHGLAEHSLRYARFAEAANAAGFHVVAADHRGHGKSIVGEPGDFGTPGFAGLWQDMAQLGDRIRDEYPDLPLFLLGHSMGSFAAQSLIVNDIDAYRGVILSGSTAIDAMAAQMADAPAADLSVFNAGFEPRTGYEWLSRDEAEVDAYVADPLCGFDLPATTVPALFSDVNRVSDPEVLATIRPDLSVLVASGTDDPLSGSGELAQLLGQRYRDAGLNDVKVVLYPGARHEILNETNRHEVTADFIAWLRDHTA